MIEKTKYPKEQLACVICDSFADRGISILKYKICEACENILLQLTPDHPDYEFHIEKIKKIWKEF